MLDYRRTHRESRRGQKLRRDTDTSFLPTVRAWPESLQISLSKLSGSDDKEFLRQDATRLPGKLRFVIHEQDSTTDGDQMLLTGH